MADTSRPAHKGSWFERRFIHLITIVGYLVVFIIGGVVVGSCRIPVPGKERFPGVLSAMSQEVVAPEQAVLVSWVGETGDKKQTNTPLLTVAMGRDNRAIASAYLGMANVVDALADADNADLVALSDAVKDTATALLPPPSETEINAPSEGTLIREPGLEPGSKVAEGDLLARICTFDSAEFVAPFSAQTNNVLKPGDTALVQFSLLAGPYTVASEFEESKDNDITAWVSGLPETALERVRPTAAVEIIAGDLSFNGQVKEVDAKKGRAKIGLQAIESSEDRDALKATTEIELSVSETYTLDSVVAELSPDNQLKVTVPALPAEVSEKLRAAEIETGVGLPAEVVVTVSTQTLFEMVFKKK